MELNFKKWNSPCQSKCAGFSLVEMLLTALIFFLTTTAFMLIILSGSSTWQINNMQLEVQQEIRKSMDWMKEDLFAAGVSTITNVPADGNWYSAISFKKSMGINNGNIIWSPLIQFALGGTNSSELQRTLGAGGAKVIAHNLKTLQFRRHSTTPDLLEVSIKTEKTTSQGSKSTSTFNFKVKLRN